MCIPLGLYALVSAQILLFTLFLIIFLVSFYWGWFHKISLERDYGDFVYVNPAMTERAVIDNAGKVLIVPGVTKTLELHFIRNLDKMGHLAREGKSGKLQIYLSFYDSIMSLRRDFEGGEYEDTGYITARSDLSKKLIELGFTEIVNPPKINLPTTFLRIIFQLFLSIRVGQSRFVSPEGMVLSVISREEFLSDHFIKTLETKIFTAKKAMG